VVETKFEILHIAKTVCLLSECFDFVDKAFYGATCDMVFEVIE